MVDYSKFDHIDSDSDNDEAQPVKLTPTIPSDTKPQLMTKKGTDGRLKFEHNGQTIYEWEQSLSEVNIYIRPPPDIPRKLFEIVIGHNHLTVGLKQAPPFINEDTGGAVKPNESLWTIVDGEININLQKMNKAEAWDCALKGHKGEVIDSHTKEEVKKQLMRERFQEEHPGFDFSGADFNGQVPDARSFMGGVKHF